MLMTGGMVAIPGVIMKKPTKNIPPKI